MSAEKIIEQIKKDAEKEINHIKKQVELEVQKIIKESNKQAEKQTESIIEDGKNQAENTKKIIISKANQSIKKEIMIEKEKIIEQCFIKAYQKLSMIKGEDYKKTVTLYLRNGIKKLGKDIRVFTTRKEDEKILEEFGLKQEAKLESYGGIKIVSSDGRVTLDYTFEGVLKRDKQKIRNKVGKLLFSNI